MPERQDTLDLDGDPKGQEQREKSPYERLIEEVGPVPDVIEDILDIASKTQSMDRFKGSDRFKQAVEAAITDREKDLRAIWPELGEQELLERARDIALRVARFRKEMSGRNVRWTRFKSARRRAIRDGSISAEFPPGFCPPPKRETRA